MCYRPFAQTAAESSIPYYIILASKSVSSRSSPLKRRLSARTSVASDSETCLTPAFDLCTDNSGIDQITDWFGDIRYLSGQLIERSLREVEMTGQKGFTLIELLTTLGVATILLSVAIPGMQEFKRNARQTGGINELVTGIRVARSTAITTNTRVTVCASESGSACQSVNWEKGWIAFVDRDADRTLDVEETIIRAGGGAEGLTIKSSQFTDFFVFRPNGRVMSASVSQNSGQFTVCDDRGAGHAKAITIDLSGRPRSIHDPAGSGLSLSCG